MYVEDVEEWKRTYRHIFIITFFIWYHLNIMLSMSKIDQIHLRAVMLCMSEIKMCLYVLFPSSTSSTYIALQPLGVFDLSLTSSTYIALHTKTIRMTSPTSSTCHIPGTLFELQ